MAKYRDIIGGLQILVKYRKDGEEAHFEGADHDIIFSHDESVSAEDKKQLEELGWFWSEEFDCWARFV